MKDETDWEGVQSMRTRMRLNVKASFMKGDDIEHVVLRSPILEINLEEASKILWDLEHASPHEARHTGGSTPLDGDPYLFDIELEGKIWGKRKAHKAARAANEVLLYFWEAMSEAAEETAVLSLSNQLADAHKVLCGMGISTRECKSCRRKCVTSGYVCWSCGHDYSDV